MGRIVQIGETFCDTFSFTAENIKTFARLANDNNPLHLDDDYAAASRFGGLIASGTQPMSYFCAMLATHYSIDRQPLGLEFDVRLKKAVGVGDTVTMQWTVDEAVWKDKLGGDIVTLHGSAINQRGETALLGTATILVCPRSQPGTEPA
ncbi:MaoC family dehydratase [Pandoraea sp.]|uniref:MaoC family dehydratase n=1 Tax=Pandoraea sp. TaxID=1883445 RepID=UPI00122A90E5|nr:MaoC family dehydratase [Pandoraea sp.]MDE2609134.1 MaoC family dehydratase [Burkholderiales bacterium]TAL52143.1 MAG: acyl dehydratase [Pandoraea sp.]TAM16034.1 MAG: acyl dehydratase [Pandoraea sp.]